MSKKMMKRTAALSALIAVALSGTVMAAPMTGDQTLANGIFSHTDFGGATGAFSSDKNWDLGSNTLMITGVNGNTLVSWSADYAVYANNFSFTGADGSKLQVSNADGTALAGGGILTHGTINVDDLVINVTDKAFYAAGVTNVTANNISITSTEGEAAFASDGGTLNIKASESVNIKGEEEAILVGGGAAVYVASQDGTAADIVIDGDIGSYNIVDVKLATAASSITGASEVYTDKAQVNLTLDNDATWNVTEDSTVTGLAGNDANIKGTDVKVTVNNPNWDSSKPGATNVTIKNSTINAEGVDLEINSAYNFAAYSGGVIQNTTINSDSDVVINQTGKDNAIGNGQNSIKANYIELNAKNGSAIYAQENANCVTTLEAETIKITANMENGGASANGIYASSGGTVNVKGFDTLDITVNNNSSTAGEGGPALNANTNGTINIEGGDVTAASDGRSAVLANGGKMTMTVDSLDASVENLEGGSSTRKNSVIGADGANADLNITVKDDLTVSGDDSAAYAIRATGGAEADVAADGTSTIDGNIDAGDNSHVGLDITGEESTLKGNITTAATGNTDITFGGGATWTTDGDSAISTLTVNDANIVMNGTNQTITVDKLAGDDIAITTDSLDNKLTAKASDADTVTVKGGGALTQTLENSSMTVDEALTKLAGVAQTANGTSIADEVSTAAGAILGAASANVNADGTIGAVSIRENTANAGLIDMTALSFMAWRGENDDLNERLGNLRNAREDRGIWTRMARAQQSYNSVSNQYSMYQIGYDQQAGDWTIGAAYSYTDGKSWFAEGTGENTHNVFSLYGTKMNDNGTFVDLVAKYGNLDYDYNLAGGIGDADYDTDAYSFSAEVGKRITSSNGAWVEPQFQLTYGTVDSTNFAAANGTVHVDSADSFVARAGVVAGKPVHKGNIYLKASYLYDFDGEVDGTFSNGTKTANISRDLGGGWWEVGFGANFDLSDATHLYLDFEKAVAGEVDVEWKWNAGVRYSF